MTVRHLPCPRCRVPPIERWDGQTKEASVMCADCGLRSNAVPCSDPADADAWILAGITWDELVAIKGQAELEWGKYWKGYDARAALAALDRQAECLARADDPAHRYAEPAPHCPRGTPYDGRP